MSLASLAARIGIGAIFPPAGAVMTALNAVPWRVVSKAALAAGVAAAIWAEHDHTWQRGWDSAQAADAATIASLNTTIADVRRATAQAQAADRAHADAVHVRDAQVSKETADALASDLASTRARYAAAFEWLRRAGIPAPAHSGSSRGPTVPGPADAASGASGTATGETLSASLAQLNEAEINTDKLAGWQAWWASVVASRGADDQPAPTSAPQKGLANGK